MTESVTKKRDRNRDKRNELMEEQREKISDEIDLMALARKLWHGRKTILVTTGVFLILGLFLALITPKEFTSNVSLLVEPGGSNPAANSAILKQLSALTGVPTASTPDALTPALYPLVVGSVYFRLEVLNQQVTESKTGARMTLSQYFDKHPPATLQGILMKYTVGLPGTIWAAIRGANNPETKSDKPPAAGKESIPAAGPTIPGLRLSVIGHGIGDSALPDPTPKEKGKIGAIGDRIKAEIKKGAVNLLQITVKMDDPRVAKEVAGSAVTTLTKYVIDYRTRKVKNDRQFIEGLHAEAEKKYRRAQQVLASFRDRNQNVVQASVIAEGENLQSEYNLAFNVYNSLSQLLEQAKINVQENTPVFTMIEPPTDAIKTSSSISTLMIMLFLGILSGVGIVFGKPVLRKFRRELKELD